MTDMLYAPAWVLLTSLAAIVIMGVRYWRRKDLKSEYMIAKIIYHLWPALTIFFILTLFPADLYGSQDSAILANWIGTPEWVDRLLVILSPMAMALCCWTEPPSFSFKVKHKW